jgi:hypothetical protein
MGAVFYTQSVPRCYKQDKLGVARSQLENRWGSDVVSCCCEKLVAEAGDSSGTQRKGNVRCWKPLPSNGASEDCNRLRRLVCPVVAYEVCRTMRVYTCSYEM